MTEAPTINAWKEPDRDPLEKKAYYLRLKEEGEAVVVEAVDKEGSHLANVGRFTTDDDDGEDTGKICLELCRDGGELERAGFHVNERTGGVKVVPR